MLTRHWNQQRNIPYWIRRVFTENVPNQVWIASKGSLCDRSNKYSRQCPSSLTRLYWCIRLGTEYDYQRKKSSRTGKIINGLVQSYENKEKSGRNDFCKHKMHWNRRQIKVWYHIPPQTVRQNVQLHGICQFHELWRRSLWNGNRISDQRKAQNFHQQKLSQVSQANRSLRLL